MKVRLAGAGVAVLALVLGAGALFAAVVVGDETSRPGSIGSGPPLGVLAVLVLIPIFVASGGLGVGLAPRAVVAAGLRPAFAAACGMLGVAIVCALPSPLVCFSWPVALVMGGVAITLFYRVTRATRAAVAGG